MLDHGLVRLVDHMGTDVSIARNARVSYDAAWRAGEDSGSDSRLIKYLLNNGHNTPFESVTFTFEVEAPIFVIRQWHRHRTQSYNEISARYRPLPEKFYIPEPHLVGKQNKDNKQMRDPMTKEEYQQLPDVERSMIESMLFTMRQNNEQAFFYYRDMISSGMPRELARSVLPMSTYTHMFTTVNLHNLFNFLRERLHEHAQYEIRQYALALLKLAEPIAPVAFAAFKQSLKGKEGYGEI